MIVKFWAFTNLEVKKINWIIQNNQEENVIDNVKFCTTMMIIEEEDEDWSEPSIDMVFVYK